MKAFLMAMLAALILGTMPAHAQSAGEKEVTALEEQWFKSEKTNNPDLAAPLFADDYVATGADGSVANKAETLEDAKSRHYTSVKYDDIKVKVYGDAAVATGVYQGKGTLAEKPFTEHLRWTDTWVKVSGKWMLVASHYSLAKAKGQGLTVNLQRGQVAAGPAECRTDRQGSTGARHCARARAHRQSSPVLR